MLTNIIAILIVAYAINKLVKGGYLVKLAEFIGLVKTSAKQNGARGTAHGIVDGIFNSSEQIKGAVKAGAGKVTGTAKAKVAGLKAQDYEFDAARGELVLFLSKESDLVLGRQADGRVYAVEVHITGKETELDKRAFERRINLLSRKGKLSESQERALKDFMNMGRTRATEAAAERTGRIPRSGK